MIKDAQSRGLNINLDTKIWMEQMGLPYSPTHVNKQNQADARHSYADLLEYPQTYRMNWTLWNGGTQRILLWSDPTYMSRLTMASRLYDGDTLAVTEMQATKMLGDPHDTPPRDFLNAKYKYTTYEFERSWAFYRSFGRMAYNPKATPDIWALEFSRRFGRGAGPHVKPAAGQSRLADGERGERQLPDVSDDQRLGGDAAPGEPAGLRAVRGGQRHRAVRKSQGRSGEHHPGHRYRHATARRDEPLVARISDGILAEATAAERAAGPGATNELKSTLADVRILAAMARYHQWRQLGGVNYNLYKATGDLTAFDAAIANEQNAVRAWRDIVTAAGDFYIETMRFGAIGRNFPQHWKDELVLLEKEFAALQAERQAAVGKSGAKAVGIPARDLTSPRPVATIEPAAGLATAGMDFPVRAKVASANGVKWIRLRYRHVNQHDDFESRRHDAESSDRTLCCQCPRRIHHPAMGPHVLRRNRRQQGARADLSGPRGRDALRCRDGEKVGAVGAVRETGGSKEES